MGSEGQLPVGACCPSAANTLHPTHTHPPPRLSLLPHPAARKLLAAAVATSTADARNGGTAISNSNAQATGNGVAVANSNAQAAGRGAVALSNANAQ